MKTTTYTHYLVVDLEATCGEGVPASEIEIIEFAAILVPIDNLHEMQVFHSYVRPELHPILTDFCTRLTNITQDDVDAAPTLTDMIRAFMQWLKVPVLFCCWSDFDWKHLHKECQRHHISLPFQHGYWDLQRKFKQVQCESNFRSVTTALEKMALTFEGQLHSAKDDALNTARLLPFCIPKIE